MFNSNTIWTPGHTKPPPGSQPDLSCEMAVGLVAGWLFNEGGGSLVNDCVSNTKGIIQSFTRSIWVGGLHGPGLFPDSSNTQYVKGTANAGATQMVTPQNGFSCSLWLYLNAAPAGGSTAGILVAPATTNVFGYRVTIDSVPQIALGINIAGTQKFAKTLTLTAAKWYHFVGTWDKSNVKAYQNGKLTATTAAAADSPTYEANPTGGVQIGFISGNKTFPGTIESCFIWNRPLTASQVWELYSAPYSFIDEPVEGKYYFLYPYSGGDAFPAGYGEPSHPGQSQYAQLLAR